MASSKPQTIALALARGKNINAADVISLLQEIYAEGISTRDEAQELIDFDRSLSSVTPGWREFFAATVSDHVINRSTPVGELDDQKTDWLIRSLSLGGRVVTEAGFAALARCIETAKESSSTLIAYAIEQLRVAVIAGEGPAIGARAHFSRMIDEQDVALLRRLLIAGGGREGRPIMRVEAEALFDLHDVVAPDANDAGFEDLFFKAVASHLIGEAGRPRCEMLSPDPRLADRSEAVRIADEADYSLPAGVAPVRLGTDEVAWLASHIMRDGRPTGAEFALLRLFGDATAGCEPTLRHYLDHAA